MNALQVNHPDVLSPTQCKDLGVAVGTPMGPEQRHIGLLYTNENEQVRFLHLAWHYFLKEEDAPQSGYVWLDSGLDQTNQTVLSQYCQLIAEKHQKGGLPYGLMYVGDLVFDPATGAWTGPQGEGLTCASFILALFKAKGFELVDLGDWPQRPEDQVWGKKILEMLESKASQEHIEAQRRGLEKGLARFRPGEVAGAVASTVAPIGFDLATQFADKILDELRVYNLRRVGIRP